MKALIQRVVKAGVSVGEEQISNIEHGLCVLVGISSNDTAKDMEYIARKILNLRIFEDDEGKKWDKNVMDRNMEVLCVSQFTLCGVLKGNKPDFRHAMSSDRSKEFYQQFLDLMRKLYLPDKIKDGVFAAYMQVSIQNDGPVTIQIESPNNASKINSEQELSNPKC